MSLQYFWRMTGHWSCYNRRLSYDDL